MYIWVTVSGLEKQNAAALSAQSPCLEFIQMNSSNHHIALTQEKTSFLLIVLAPGWMYF